jgi:XXXCH domain-containing protein
MKELEKKLKHTITEAELGNYLRRVADALDGQAAQNYAELNDCLNDYAKIDLKIKRKSGEVVVKLKIKSSAIPAEITADDDSVSTEEALPKYKKLKKRMKSSFKAISESLLREELPDAHTVKSFIADSELMISYPAYGEEYYPAYREALVHCAEAFEKRDKVFFKQTYTRLKQLRNQCHQRYR